MTYSFKYEGHSYLIGIQIVCISIVSKMHRHSSKEDVSLVTMATGLPSFTLEKANLPCNFVLHSNKT